MDSEGDWDWNSVFHFSLYEEHVKLTNGKSQLEGGGVRAVGLSRSKSHVHVQKLVSIKRT